MPTFDGDNLLITLDPGVTEVNVVTDLFKAWKDFMLAHPRNRKYPHAFVSDGGAPLTDTINQGSYIFINNTAGWRIKPPEEDIDIFFVGNIAPLDINLRVLQPTTGAFTVGIFGLQPITQGVDEVVSVLNDSVTNLQFLVESLRPEPSAFGNVWYWDPVNGSDANDGTRPTTAFATFAFAHTVATANNADVIFLINTSGGGLTVTERISISKNDLILRGPGPGVLFQPVDDTGPTITVTGTNVSLSGFKCTSTGATPQPVISVVGADNFTGSGIWIEGGTEDGIHVSNCLDPVIKDFTIETTAANGIHLLNTINARVFDTRIQRCTGYGIELEETTTARDAWIARNVLHHNGPGAINIGTGVSMTMITKDNMIGPPKGKNFADLIVNNGGGTHNEWEEWWDSVFEAWQRLDLDPDRPNIYADDGTLITGTNFTLTRTDNGNGTSTVQRS